MDFLLLMKGENFFSRLVSPLRDFQSFWWIVDFASARLQAQGTGQGVFFDLETFDPLFGPNPAFIKALELFKQTGDYGPADELTVDLNTTRDLFLTGRCALTMDWGDIGSLSIDPERSTMQDKVGTIVIPGSTEVLDRTTGELVPCDETTCPHAVDGINYAPFAAFGGWGGAVSSAADQEVKDAAYAFFSYLNQPAQSNVDVTIGAKYMARHNGANSNDLALSKTAMMSANGITINTFHIIYMPVFIRACQNTGSEEMRW